MSASIVERCNAQATGGTGLVRTNLWRSTHALHVTRSPHPGPTHRMRRRRTRRARTAANVATSALGFETLFRSSCWMLLWVQADPARLVVRPESRSLRCRPKPLAGCRGRRLGARRVWLQAAHVRVIFDCAHRECQAATRGRPPSRRRRRFHARYNGGSHARATGWLARGRAV